MESWKRERPNPALSLELPEELVELVARRAAELVREELAGPHGFMDVEAAATFLACPKSRIYALVSARRIPHHRDGSRLLFDRDELRRWVGEGGRRDRDRLPTPLPGRPHSRSPCGMTSRAHDPSRGS